MYPGRTSSVAILFSRWDLWNITSKFLYKWYTSMIITHKRWPFLQNSTWLSLVCVCPVKGVILSAGESKKHMMKKEVMMKSEWGSVQSDSHTIYLRNNASNMTKVSRLIERWVTVRKLFQRFLTQRSTEIDLEAVYLH